MVTPLSIHTVLMRSRNRLVTFAKSTRVRIANASKLSAGEIITAFDILDSSLPIMNSEMSKGEFSSASKSILSIHAGVKAIAPTDWECVNSNAGSIFALLGV